MRMRNKRETVEGAKDTGRIFVNLCSPKNVIDLFSASQFRTRL